MVVYAKLSNRPHTGPITWEGNFVRRIAAVGINAEPLWQICLYHPGDGRSSRKVEARFQMATCI